MPALTFVYHAPLVCQVFGVLFEKFTKEDVVLYCQLNALYPSPEKKK